MSFQEHFPLHSYLLSFSTTALQLFQRPQCSKLESRNLVGERWQCSWCGQFVHGTQLPFSCCCLKPSPGHMPYSPVQASKSDQPAASRQVKPLNLSPSTISKGYAKLNLRTDSHHGEKPNNALNARCLVLICFKTGTFREPTLATGCKYSKQLSCTNLGKWHQCSEVRRLPLFGLNFMDT